jgi:D-sedoheptulose 7-phosphate isomerase
MTGHGGDALVATIVRKAEESARTKEHFFRENGARIVACARAVAVAFDRGARLLVMGNGGSACDAQHAAVEFMHPIVAKRPPLPALALGQGAALTSAVANDEDFALGLAKELRLLARSGDVVLALSTSGKSANVLRALATARELGLVTVGFSGRDGGKMAPLCDHLFTVTSFSTHRIQETHETLLHVLWDVIHVIRGEEDVI